MVATTEILAESPINGDFYFFSAMVVVMGAALAWWMQSKKLLKRAYILSLGATSLILLGAWVASKRAGVAERDRLIYMLSGMSRTYASEMEFMGHASLPSDPSASETPAYLAMIAAEKRWLAANSQINDVYTFRQNSKGEKILIVDSETDYDRNGRIEGETEERTKIGEPWEGNDPALNAAFEGRATFSPYEIKDRWGSWYSYYTPLRRPDGTLDGVLGIDLSSKEVLGAVSRARVAALGYYGLLYLALVALSCGAGVLVMSRRNEAEIATAAEAARERDKMQNLVLAIEGSVWESSLNPLDFAYVSQHADSLLAVDLGQWLTPGFWESHLHPDDREHAIAQRKAAMTKSERYRSEYRMINEEGETIWVRERGLVHQSAGGPVLRGVMQNVTAEKQRKAEIEGVQRQLVEASRQAGMAEVATGVLHNVGNVLNGVNISSTLIKDALQQSSLPHLKSAADLLTSQPSLPEFFSSNRGAALPGFLNDLHAKLSQQQGFVLQEVETLRSSVEHIKDIVMMQQSYARMGGRTEPLNAVSMVEDALHINDAGLRRHHIEVVKNFDQVPPIMAERNKVLQILVNLIRNAKHALDECDRSDRRLTLSIEMNEQQQVQITIADNGVGISPINMTRLFSYGFTTRKTGHGFGLHSSVNTAREMGGSLFATSEGENKGASFTLCLPCLSDSPNRRSSAPIPSTERMANSHPATLQQSLQPLPA